VWDFLRSEPQVIIGLEARSDQVFDRLKTKNASSEQEEAFFYSKVEKV
jgi:hypothetical protein